MLATARYPHFADWAMPLLFGLLRDSDRAVRQKVRAVMGRYGPLWAVMGRHGPLRTFSNRY